MLKLIKLYRHACSPACPAIRSIVSMNECMSCSSRCSGALRYGFVTDMDCDGIA